MHPFKFGVKFDATAAGVEVMGLARAEMEANRSKRDVVEPNSVADYDIAAGGPIATEHVWVDCATKPDGSTTMRRACYVDRGDRTPQVGDEIAITGFGGMVWWSGRVISMQPPSSRGRAAKLPTYIVEVFYAADSSKTGLRLSTKTYGPAQCKVGDVRVGSTNVPRSFSAGWVFLVPVAGQ